MSWASKPVKGISVDGLLHEPPELQAFRNSFLFKHSESLHPVSCWGDIGGLPVGGLQTPGLEGAHWRQVRQTVTKKAT